MYDRASKLRVTFDDERAVIEQIDLLAANEAISRADMIRRALRHLLVSVAACTVEVTATSVSQSDLPAQSPQALPC